MAAAAVEERRAILAIFGDADWLTAALLVFNLADALFTSFYLHLGVAEEVNPIMRLAWRSSPIAFMVVKLLVVQIGAFILWLNRDSRPAVLAIKIGTGLYFAICAWHLLFAARLLSH